MGKADPTVDAQGFVTLGDADSPFGFSAGLFTCKLCGSSQAPTGPVTDAKLFPHGQRCEIAALIADTPKPVLLTIRAVPLS